MSDIAKADAINIVLVHGAFADATGWQYVIPLLEKEGYNVTAVQNPLTSLADDIKTTKRLIAAQRGPTVVVGHSYGGMVTTSAAAGEPNVKALVYLAAYAPDAGEKIGDLNEKYPATPLATALVPDAAGFLYVDRARFHDIFCADVPEGEARVMAATQKPISSVAFGESVEAAAWKTVPSWFVVSQEDKVISPDLERWEAQRMNAKTTELKASHVAFLSHPEEVAAVIREAAATAAKG
jgi:pimeloyl-ACP methyl ester carboxylesterase